GGEVAFEPGLSRRAEPAGEGAADLGGNAGGEPVMPADKDSFDGVAVRQGEEEFFRAGTAFARAQRQAAQLYPLLFRPALQRLRQIGMGRKEIAIGNGAGGARVQALERGTVEVEGKGRLRGTRRGGRGSGENGGGHGAIGGSECRLGLRFP